MRNVLKVTQAIAVIAFVLAGCMVDGEYFAQCIAVIIATGLYLAASALVFNR